MSTKKRTAKTRKAAPNGKKNGKHRHSASDPKEGTERAGMGQNGADGQADEDDVSSAKPVSPAEQAKMTKEIFRRESDLADHIAAIEDKKRALSDAIEPFYRRVGRGFIDRDTGRIVYLGRYEGLYFLKKPAQPKVVEVG